MDNSQELQPNVVHDDHRSEDNVDDIPDDFATEEESDDNTSDLPLGDVLSISDAYSCVTAKDNSTFIALVGPSGCGKTTLFTAIYHLFQKNTIDNYYFAGSETLLGFEQRAYLRRLRSEQTVPETPKTRRGVKDLLHIKIWDSCADKFYNLLISDFSGEDFSNIRANIEYAKSEFGVIKSAKCIVLLLDGELISNKEKRNSTLDDATELLRTFAYADLLRSTVSIVVAISKYDIVKRKYLEESSLHNYENYIKKRFDDIAKIINKEILYTCVSVIPDSTIEYDNEESLKDMLKKWIDSSSYNKNYTYHEPQSMKSQFNCYYRKSL